MVKLQIDIRPDPLKDWDNNLLKSKYASIHQTTYYARNLERLGRKVHFASLKLNGDVVAQNLVHIQYASSYFSTSILGLRPFPTKIPPAWMSLEYGPIFWGTSDHYAYLFVKMIQKTLGNIPVLRALPHPLMSDQPEAFRELGFKVLPQHSFLLDLTSNIEELWKNIKRKTRGNISRALKQSVSVETVNSVSDFNEYFSLLNQSRRRHKMKPVNYLILYDMWKDMTSHNVMRLFVAKYKGRVVAGYLMPFFSGYMNYWGVAQSVTDEHIKLYSTDLLMWKIIEWGHYNSQKYLDFTLGTVKVSGVSFFKGKWGGRGIYFHEYSNISPESCLMSFSSFVKNLIG